MNLLKQKNMSYRHLYAPITVGKKTGGGADARGAVVRVHYSHTSHTKVTLHQLKQLIKKKAT